MTNRRKRLQKANELFSDQEAKAHINNLGIVHICAEMQEVGATTHDERYGNLQTSPT